MSLISTIRDLHRRRARERRGWRLDAQHVAGSYDLSFPDGWPYGTGGAGTIKGTFDAPLCDPGSGIVAVTCK